MSVLSTILLFIGAAFFSIAAVGLVKLPDVYTRMQASAKATTLGVGLILVAAAVHFRTVGAVLRAVGILFFFYLTSPIAAHMIGRAAYYTGIPVWHGRAAEDDMAHDELARTPPARNAPQP